MEPTASGHRLVLSQRKRLTVTDVTEVVSFGEEEAVVRTGLGLLLVRGSGLQLRQLGGGDDSLTVEGEVSALIYESASRRTGLLGRLLK